MNFRDLTGQRFYHVRVLEREGSDEHGRATWRCKCECGNEFVARGDNLRHNATRSCGCHQGNAKHYSRTYKQINRLLTNERMGV